MVEEVRENSRVKKVENAIALLRALGHRGPCARTTAWSLGIKGGPLDDSWKGKQVPLTMCMGLRVDFS